jgi:polysaccharide export outer membrane protein
MKIIIASLLSFVLCSFVFSPAYAVKEKIRSTKTVEVSAPAEATPATESKEAMDPSYAIIAGDILQITVWKEETLDREVIVLPDGTINFPLVGSVQVQGLTPAKAQTAIKEKLLNFIPDASVAVSVKATLGHTVSVIGQVNKPGEIIMGRRFTVMQALSQAGGLTPYARENRIIILRRVDGEEISIPFPYNDIAAGRDLEQNIFLKPGDVVVVPTSGLF